MSNLLLKLSNKKNVGLVVDMRSNHGRLSLQGIQAFVKEHEDFLIVSNFPYDNIRELDLADGFIITIGIKEEADRVIQVAEGRPVVNLYGEGLDNGIMLNDFKVGELVAEHFLQRCFENFAYVSHLDEYEFSKQRARGFKQTLDNAGFGCHELCMTWYEWFEDGKLERMVQVNEWLQSLPKPCAVMASHDSSAATVLMASIQHGLKVPNDIAICAVDDDPLICNMHQPSLSSVAMPFQMGGYLAAKMLREQMIRGDRNQRTVTLDPLGVVMRQSSDIMNVNDEDVLAAVKLIEAKMGQPINISDILEHVPVSRRTLERRFSSCLGQSPYEYLLQARMNRAKYLLVSSDEPVGDIVGKTGFMDHVLFSKRFRKVCGLSPTEYRKKFRKT